MMRVLYIQTAFYAALSSLFLLVRHISIVLPLENRTYTKSVYTVYLLGGLPVK